jgi:neurobeachin-like protein 1/2
VELVAMATAKLHALIQTRHMSDPEEAAYLLCYLDTIVQNSLKGTQPEHYSFVLPVMKALLARISPTLALSTRLPSLPDTQAGPSFFERFQAYAQTPEWRALIDDKVGQKNHFLLQQYFYFICDCLNKEKVLIN